MSNLLKRAETVRDIENLFRCDSELPPPSPEALRSLGWTIHLTLMDEAASQSVIETDETGETTLQVQGSLN